MRIAALFVGLLMIVGSGPALAGDRGKSDDHRKNFEANLSGYNEVHFAAGPPATLRGAVSTGASGRFKATIDDRMDMIRYEISYSGLEAPVTQAHIHFGQRHTVGGIVVWLCQTEGTPAPPAVAGLTPTCPASGTVSGTITPAQVLTATGQGLDAGQFDELVASAEISAATNPWWVNIPTLANYFELLTSNQYLTFFRNSALVSIIVVTITMLISVPAAFALSRMRFWGSATLATGVFLTYLIPETLLFIPLFKMFAVFNE